MRIADLDQVHLIITDDDLRPDIAALYGERLLLVPLAAPLATIGGGASFLAT